MDLNFREVNRLVGNFQQILSALGKVGALRDGSFPGSSQRAELECAHAAIRRAAGHAHEAIWAGFSECMGYDNKGDI